MADLRESAVGPAQLACNGGNGVIRTPTRRRHAGGRLHMAQKPLCRSAWRAARGLLEWKWLRCRWVVAGPVGKRPPDWRAARGLLGWRRLRRRWAVAGQAANGRPTGGWCEACWGGGGCGAGGRRQGRPRAARRSGGARPHRAAVGWPRALTRSLGDSGFDQ